MNNEIQEIRYQVGEAWKGTYNAGTTYGNANVVQDPTGLSVYRSLKPGNVGHPLTDTAWWFLIIDLSSIKEESDRIKALNDAIAADEAQRVENENGRVTAEQGRVDAENARVTAEQGRVTAEQQRVLAEQQRASQEQTRISQEQSRVTAEQGRVAAEEQRVQKEQLRENNEAQRVINETNRVAAEAERVEQYAADHQQAVADHDQYVDSLGAFDISAYHATGGVLAKYAGLTAALGTGGANIPEAIRKGGMSVKFVLSSVLSSDNKYVQYRLMTDDWSTNVSDWNEDCNSILQDRMESFSKMVSFSANTDITETFVAANEQIATLKQNIILSKDGDSIEFTLKSCPFQGNDNRTHTFARGENHSSHIGIGLAANYIEVRADDGTWIVESELLTLNRTFKISYENGNIVLYRNGTIESTYTGQKTITISSFGNGGNNMGYWEGSIENLKINGILVSLKDLCQTFTATENIVIHKLSEDDFDNIESIPEIAESVETLDGVVAALNSEVESLNSEVESLLPASKYIFDSAQESYFELTNPIVLSQNGDSLEFKIDVVPQYSGGTDTNKAYTLGYNPNNTSKIALGISQFICGVRADDSTWLCDIVEQNMHNGDVVKISYENDNVVIYKNGIAIATYTGQKTLTISSFGNGSQGAADYGYWDGTISNIKVNGEKYPLVGTNHNVDVVFDEEVNELVQELVQEVFGISITQPTQDDKVNAYISASGAIVTGANWCVFVDVSKLNGFHITQLTTTPGDQYAFLKSKGETSVEFVDGTGRVDGQLNNTLIPEGAIYLYILLGTHNSDPIPTLSLVEGETKPIREELKKKQDVIVDEETRQETFSKDSPLLEYVGNYYQSSDGALIESPWMHLYQFVAEDDIDLWWVSQTSGNDVILAIYLNGVATTANFVTPRMRNNGSTNTLPTSENKLHIAKGRLVTISYETGDFVFAYTYTQKIFKSGILLSEEQVAQAQGGEIGKISISVNSDYYGITMNGYDIRLIHYVNAGRNADCWTINEINKNGTVVLPSGTDVVGVLKEKNQNNFMGGYAHGNEQIVDFHILADGNAITENVNCNTVDVFMYSHLFRVSNPSENIIDRYTHINFKDGCITIETTFKCLVDNFQLDIAYNGGMWAWRQSLAQFATTNIGILTASGTSIFGTKHELISASALLGTGLVSAENILGFEQTKFKGEAYYYGNEGATARMKIYYSTDDNSTWESGHLCVGKACYTLN